MAARTIRIDDLDGTEHEVTTVHFGYEGQDFTIDLSAANVAELETMLDSYIAVATPVANGQTAVRARATQPRPARNGEAIRIREWAQAEGIAVSERGRISGTVIAAYQRAHAA